MPTGITYDGGVLDVLDLPTFLRKFEQRAYGVMWLLGAGASRASDIKTAGDMIWDFKARLYRSAKGVPASAVSDLGDQRIRDVLQNFFDATDRLPLSMRKKNMPATLKKPIRMRRIAADILTV